MSKRERPVVQPMSAPMGRNASSEDELLKDVEGTETETGDQGNEGGNTETPKEPETPKVLETGGGEEGGDGETPTDPETKPEEPEEPETEPEEPETGEEGEKSTGVPGAFNVLCQGGCAGLSGTTVLDEELPEGTFEPMTGKETMRARAQCRIAKVTRTVTKNLYNA